MVCSGPRRVRVTQNADPWIGRETRRRGPVEGTREVSEDTIFRLSEPQQRDELSSFDALYADLAVAVEGDARERVV